MALISAGESERIYCEQCDTTYEVIYEPDKARGSCSDSPDFCPFCGEELE